MLPGCRCESCRWFERQTTFKRKLYGLIVHTFGSLVALTLMGCMGAIILLYLRGR